MKSAGRRATTPRKFFCPGDKIDRLACLDRVATLGHAPDGRLPRVGSVVVARRRGAGPPVLALVEAAARGGGFVARPLLELKDLVRGAPRGDCPCLIADADTFEASVRDVVRREVDVRVGGGGGGGDDAVATCAHRLERRGGLRIDALFPPKTCLGVGTGSPLRTLDLFAGAGLMTAGAEMAGARCVGAAEIDANACKTFRHNFPRAVLHQGDVADVLRGADGGALAAALDAGELPFDVLVGGSPCQSFSSMKHVSREERKVDLGPLSTFCEIVRRFRPPMVVHENVVNIMDPGAPYHSPFALLVGTLLQEGYSVDVRNVCMAHYGVPQRRMRNVIVAVRDGPLPKFPAPTTSCPLPPIKSYIRKLYPLTLTQDDPALPRVPTAEEACADLAHVRVARPGTCWKRPAKYRKPPRGRYHPYQRQARKKARDTVFNHVVPRVRSDAIAEFGAQPADAPFNTITTQSTLHASNVRHFEKRRRRLFTVRELMRAQGAPDSMVLACGYTAARRQVGNGVPPLFAKQLFVALSGGAKRA